LSLPALVPRSVGCFSISPRMAPIRDREGDVTIRLSNAMQMMLKVAPDHWSRISPGPTVVALETRGLVDLRDTPGETGLMRGTQWRINDSGRAVDGRGPAPTYDVTVWGEEGEIVKKLWDASQDEVDEVYEQFEDEPNRTIQVGERP
jgi:hypothetical protein